MASKNFASNEILLKSFDHFGKSSSESQKILCFQTLSKPLTPPAPLSLQNDAPRLCRECHLHNRYPKNRFHLYPSISPDSPDQKYWYCKKPKAFLRHRCTDPYRIYRGAWDTLRNNALPADKSDNTAALPYRFIFSLYQRSWKGSG